jgi:hypothetical protein
MSLLYLRHELRRNECFIRANVPNTSSRIEIFTIFFETNIMSDLSCTLCEYLAKVSVELIAIYFHSFEIVLYQSIKKNIFSLSEAQKAKIELRFKKERGNCLSLSSLALDFLHDMIIHYSTIFFLIFLF